MPGKVIWRHAAEEDLTEAFLFLAGDSPAAAERIAEAVGDAVQLLLENPSAGRKREFRSPRALGTRSWPLSGFPSHFIFYRAHGHDIEIIRILHAVRDIPRVLGEPNRPASMNGSRSEHARTRC